MKKGYYGHIEQLTENNTAFRHVLYSGMHLQLVLMALAPGEEIGEEVHADNDQFFRVEAGTGLVTIDGTEYMIADGDAIIAPAGARHNVRNTGDDALKLYALYAPPHHKDGVVRATREGAIADEPEFDGVPTEV